MGTVIVGSLFILYGLFTLYARLTGHVSWLKKLPAMQERYGKKWGNVIHVLAYTFVPLWTGAFFLFEYFVNHIDFFCL